MTTLGKLTLLLMHADQLVIDAGGRRAGGQAEDRAAAFRGPPVLRIRAAISAAMATEASAASANTRTGIFSRIGSAITDSLTIILSDDCHEVVRLTPCLSCGAEG